MVRGPAWRFLSVSPKGSKARHSVLLSSSHKFPDSSSLLEHSSQEAHPGEAVKRWSSGWGLRPAAAASPVSHVNSQATPELQSQTWGWA